MNTYETSLASSFTESVGRFVGREDSRDRALVPGWDADVSHRHPEAPGECRPAPAPGAHPTVWSGVLARLVLPLVGFILVLWNSLLIFAFVWWMPQNDFCRMYYSGAAFWEGKDMYAWNPGTPARVDEDTTIYLWNMNPPHFHLVMLPFALFPIEFAMVGWWLANFFCLVFCLRLILREVNLQLTPQVRRYGLLGLLGFTGTSAVIMTGQFSFMLMVPVTLLWIHARRGRWQRAGAYLGLAASVKPFLLILVPYLFLRRQWSALASGAGVGILCFAAGLLIFGMESHRSWCVCLGLAGSWAWLPLNASLRGMLDRTLMETIYFEPAIILAAEQVKLLWLGLSLAVGAITMVAVWRDEAPAGVDRSLAMLLVASVLLCPLGWTYYYWLALGPVVAVLVSWSRQTAPEAAPSRRLVCARRLMWLALPGLFWPLILSQVGQPSPLSTLVFANLFFWSTLLVWAALVIVRRPAGGTSMATQGGTS